MARRKPALLIEGNFQFRGKLVGIKRAAGKKSFANLDRWHFSAAIVDQHDEVFGVRLFVYIYFRELHTAFPQELFGATTVHAPTRAVQCDFFHRQFIRISHYYPRGWSVNQGFYRGTLTFRDAGVSLVPMQERPASFARRIVTGQSAGGTPAPQNLARAIRSVA